MTRISESPETRGARSVRLARLFERDAYALATFTESGALNTLRGFDTERAALDAAERKLADSSVSLCVYKRESGNESSVLAAHIRKPGDMLTRTELAARSAKLSSNKKARSAARKAEIARKLDAASVDAESVALARSRAERTKRELAALNAQSDAAIALHASLKTHYAAERKATRAALKTYRAASRSVKHAQSVTERVTALAAQKKAEHALFIAEQTESAAKRKAQPVENTATRDALRFQENANERKAEQAFRAALDAEIAQLNGALDTHYAELDTRFPSVDAKHAAETKETRDAERAALDAHVTRKHAERKAQRDAQARTDTARFSDAKREFDTHACADARVLAKLDKTFALESPERTALVARKTEKRARKAERKARNTQRDAERATQRKAEHDAQPVLLETQSTQNGDNKLIMSKKANAKLSHDAVLNAVHALSAWNANAVHVINPERCVSIDSTRKMHDANGERLYAYTRDTDKYATLETLDEKRVRKLDAQAERFERYGVESTEQLRAARAARKAEYAAQRAAQSATRSAARSAKNGARVSAAQTIQASISASRSENLSESDTERAARKAEKKARKLEKKAETLRAMNASSAAQHAQSATQAKRTRTTRKNAESVAPERTQPARAASSRVQNEREIMTICNYLAKLGLTRKQFERDSGQKLDTLAVYPLRDIKKALKLKCDALNAQS